MTGHERRVVAILTKKAGWFRQDDELAAHERALHVLGWSPVTLRVRPDADCDELAGFLDRADPALVWVRGDVALPAGFTAVLEEHPALVIHDGPRGVDRAILEAAPTRHPQAVRGDVSVVSAAPSSLLRTTVERLDEANTTVVAYGDWTVRPWFEPHGRALVVALRSATVHLAEVNAAGEVPHTAHVAAAAGTAMVLVDATRQLDAYEAGSEVLAASSADEALGAVIRLLGEAETRTQLVTAARARVLRAHRLEPGWQELLDRLPSRP